MMALVVLLNWAYELHHPRSGCCDTCGRSDSGNAGGRRSHDGRDVHGRGNDDTSSALKPSSGAKNHAVR